MLTVLNWNLPFKGIKYKCSKNIVLVIWLSYSYILYPKVWWFFWNGCVAPQRISCSSVNPAHLTNAHSGGCWGIHHQEPVFVYVCSWGNSVYAHLMVSFKAICTSSYVYYLPNILWASLCICLPQFLLLCYGCSLTMVLLQRAIWQSTSQMIGFVFTLS